VVTKIAFCAETTLHENISGDVVVRDVVVRDVVVHILKHLSG
jgi:hypothetical protein